MEEDSTGSGSEVDTPQDVKDGSVMGVKNAAVRKLEQELGIVRGELKVRKRERGAEAYQMPCVIVFLSLFIKMCHCLHAIFLFINF